MLSKYTSIAKVLPAFIVQDIVVAHARYMSPRTNMSPRLLPVTSHSRMKLDSEARLNIDVTSTDRQARS